MARPPIIISNGGILQALLDGITVKNLNQITVKGIEDTIMGNIANLNEKASGNKIDRPIARRIESKNKKDPKILWCLANEPIGDLKDKLQKWGVKDRDAELSG